MQVFHIRKPLTPQRGNQFYKDRSDRSNGTYCGAGPTEFDVASHHKAVAWADHVPCKHCIQLRSK